jgi:Domain of unknown function (DUF222)
MLRQREHDWAAPGPELAAQLAMVDPATIDHFELVELIAAFEQLSGWVAAGQVVAMAELSRRTVFEGCQLAPIRLAGMEVAARLSLAPATGEHRVTVARTLVDQLPDTLTALRRGDVDYRRAAVVAEAVPGLTPEQTEEVEGRVLPKAGSRSLGRHRAAVERAVLEVDPRGMEERHKTAVELRRIDFYPQPDGMGSAQAYLPADGLASLRAALDAAASAIRSDHPGDGRTMDQLRIDALVQMAQDSLRTGRLGGDGGGQRLATAHGRRPLIQVTVPFSTLLGLGDQPGELAGYGPIPASMARRIAADGTWRRLLTDPASGALLDYGKTRYQPPPDLVDHVIARDRRCRFPGCGQPAYRCQIDHTIPSQEGPTADTNLGPLCLPHHVAKTHAGWRLMQTRPGRFVWISPVGQVYRVEPEAVGPIIDALGADPTRSTDDHQPSARDP